MTKPGLKHDSEAQRAHSKTSPWRLGPTCNTPRAHKAFREAKEKRAAEIGARKPT